MSSPERGGQSGGFSDSRLSASKELMLEKIMKYSGNSYLVSSASLETLV
jgi:hypothetical protein